MISSLYPWQQSLWDVWVDAWQQGKLPHALGISYNPDLGSRELITNFTQFLLCQKPNQFACGHCKSCQLFMAKTHPDYYLIQPEDEKRIGIEQIRALQEKIGLRANQSGAKVIILERAEWMTEAAANALLKTLEEPPAGTYFLVSPERFSRLMATVRSRITAYTSTLPSLSELATWLATQHIEVTSEALLQGYQAAPLKALKKEGSIELPISVFGSISNGNPVEIPDTYIAQIDWLDSLITEMVIGLRTLKMADTSTGDAALNFWHIQFKTRPQLAEAIQIWYKRALTIKQQLQSSHLNGKPLLAQLLTSIQLFIQPN